MTKVAISTIPPAWQPLLDKILAHFDNQMYPTWATRFLHLSRSAKKAVKTISNVPNAKDYWNVLSAADKAIWKAARFRFYRSSYSLFLADFAYRVKNGLSLPGTPPVNFQVYGLVMDNPDGLEQVEASYDEKDMVGPITLKFSYQKTEYSPPDPYSFGVHADLYYFEDGLNKVETLDWVSPSGNISWSLFDETFGTPGRKYFHVVVIFYSQYYDATVFLDNFRLKDSALVDVWENWKVKPDLIWDYTPLYRKQGWSFYPDFEDLYFSVVYLGN